MSLGLQFELMQFGDVSSSFVFLQGEGIPNWLIAGDETGALEHVSNFGGPELSAQRSGIYRAEVIMPVILSIYSLDLLEKGTKKIPVEWSQGTRGYRWASETLIKKAWMSGSPVGYLLAIMSATDIQLATGQGVTKLAVGDQIDFEEGSFVVNPLEA